MSALPPPVNPRVLREKLRAHFGFRQFRPGQLEAVKCAMEGHNVLVKRHLDRDQEARQLPTMKCGHCDRC